MARTACLGYHEVTDDASGSGFQRPLAMRYKHTDKSIETIAREGADERRHGGG